MGEVEWVNENSTSACELVLELILDSKLKINKSIAQNIYCGMISDSERFLYPGTTYQTFYLLARLLHETNLNIVSLYPRLYERPLSELRFKSFISANLEVTKNGLAHITITGDNIKEYGVDASTASNMVNDFNFIKEILVWVFITHDEPNGVYKINIRSRGPIINEVAAKFNGGGHKFASGIKTTDARELPNILDALDQTCQKYQENNQSEK